MAIFGRHAPHALLRVQVVEVLEAAVREDRVIARHIRALQVLHHSLPIKIVKTHVNQYGEKGEGADRRLTRRCSRSKLILSCLLAAK